MTEHTPSWVGATSPAPAQHRRDRQRVPVRLGVAAAVTVLLAGAESAHVAGRDELVPGLRVFLVLVVLGQVALAAAAARRSAGAALGLLVYDVTTVLAALVGGFGELRLALAAGAVVVLALVASSLGAFPAIALPPLDPGPDHD